MEARDRELGFAAGTAEVTQLLLQGLIIDLIKRRVVPKKTILELIDRVAFVIDHQGPQPTDSREHSKAIARDQLSTLYAALTNPAPPGPPARAHPRRP